MNQVKSMSDIHEGSHSSSHDNHESVIELLYHLVDKEKFYDTAESILVQIDDLEDLAKCARIVEQREPGSMFYRAKFWSRIDGLINASGNDKKNKKKFLRLCRHVEVHPTRVKNYVACGRIIESVENASLLREAPEVLFQNAQRQKERASEYLIEAASILKENPSASPYQIHKKWCQQNGSIATNLDIIKPSDWWAFGQPKWRKEEDFPGSIPGEIYANALYYFAPQVGVVVDPMAGSGMLKRVYDDRELWQKDLDFNLEIYLYDLHPCRDSIVKHDAKKPLPVKADWIFLDPPYFGQSSHLFKDEFALSKDKNHYLSLLEEVIEAMAESLNLNGKLCIFLPKWSGTRPEDPNSNIPADAYAFAIESGLHWIDTTFVSRGRQQNPGSAIQNNIAKRDRRMRSDTCVLNVFEK